MDWFGLAWQAWLTLAVVVALLWGLVRDVARPDVLMLGAVGLLLATGVLSAEDAFGGFSNHAMLTVASLFIVAAGIQHTGALAFADGLLLGASTRLPSVMGRLMLTTATLSAFLNNTPIVAMLIPRVQAWSERTGVPASKLMIPLSYAAILGGMTTLVGTSTNLLVSGLLVSAGYEPLGLFDLTWIGLPAALAAILYFVVYGHRLLPDRRREQTGTRDGLSDCLFEVRLSREAPMAGETIAEAGLRSLEQGYLVHLRRGDDLLPATPDTALRPGDVLTFHGTPALLDRLLQRPGFERVVPGLAGPRQATLPLFEAVVAPSSHLVGRTLKEAGFREKYRGVVLGIHRRDTPVEGALGRVPLRAGDLLLVEAQNGFDHRWNASREEFLLVAARRPGRLKPRSGKAPLALAILVGLILTAALGVAPIVTTAFVGALAMLAFRILPGREARRALDLPVLVVIAAALALGRAIESSGLAGVVATTLVDAASALGPIGVVGGVYLATSLLTEIITNNAAAAVMLPIGLAAAGQTGAPPEAFALAVAVAASASFVTPIGYQTNLMVLAAGGYRFSDFIRTGIAVNLVVMAAALAAIALVWL